MKWPLAKLEDLALQTKGAIVSGPFGSNIGSRFFVDEGVPIIRGNNLTFGHRRFIDEGFVYLTEAKAQDFRNCEAVADDLVLTAAGSIGQVGIIPKDTRFERYIISNKQLRVRCDQAKVSPLFLFLWLTTDKMRQHIIGRNNGGAVPLINLGILRGLPVPLPPKEVQQRIVDILSAYDDLIENNRRRMALLEESARQLYREWFIRLRFPGHEHIQIVNGVPAGWTNLPLSACAEFRSGGTPSKARTDYWDGDVPWVSSGELTSLRIRTTSLSITNEGAEAGSRLVPANTILAVVRGMSLAKEFRIGLAARTVAFNQDLKAICARPGIEPLFLFYALDFQRDAIRGRTGEASHGTKKLDTAVLAEVPVLLPTGVLQHLFSEQATSLHAQWDNFAKQNELLRAARDLLLPRLMSGELAV